MNIIFTSKDQKDFWQERQEANKGCYICPNCGEWRQAFAYDLIGKNTPLNRHGIDIFTERRRFIDEETGEPYTASIDCFECNTCKSRWESEQFDKSDEEYVGILHYDGDDPLIDDDDGEMIFIDEE